MLGTSLYSYEDNFETLPLEITGTDEFYFVEVSADKSLPVILRALKK